MKTLFLTHYPHESHLAFAHAAGARVEILPLEWFVNLAKRMKFIASLIIPISFVLSLFVRFKEDVILVEGGTSFFTAVFLKCRRKGVKLVYMDIDMFFLNIRGDTRRPPFYIVFFLRSIDAVITYDTPLRHVPEIVKVPVHMITPFPKSAGHEFPARKNYGLYVGRLSPEKKIDRVLRFAAQCPYFEKFYVVGDGMLKRYVERASELNGKIVYAGRREDVGKYYRMCRFFIHIPDKEPYGCTPMEAALGGCYPIISGSVGVAHLFDRAFVVDDPDDFKEINVKMKSILDDEKRAGRLLRESIRKFPTRDASVDNFMRVFEEVKEELEA